MNSEENHSRIDAMVHLGVVSSIEIHRGPRNSVAEAYLNPLNQVSSVIPEQKELSQLIPPFLDDAPFFGRLEHVQKGDIVAIFSGFSIFWCVKSHKEWEKVPKEEIAKILKESYRSGLIFARSPRSCGSKTYEFFKDGLIVLDRFDSKTGTDTINVLRAFVRDVVSPYLFDVRQTEYHLNSKDLENLINSLETHCKNVAVEEQLEWVNTLSRIMNHSEDLARSDILWNYIRANFIESVQIDELTELATKFCPYPGFPIEPAVEVALKILELDGKLDYLEGERSYFAPTVAEKKREKIHYQVVIDFEAIRSAAKGKGLILDVVLCPYCGAKLRLPEAGNLTICENCKNQVKATDVFDKLRGMLGL